MASRVSYSQSSLDYNDGYGSSHQDNVTNRDEGIPNHDYITPNRDIITSNREYEQETELVLKRFNLNGHRFNVSEVAFSRINPGVLRQSFQIYDETNMRKEYFFKRNGECFGTILDYFENGQLHMPQSVCPFVFEQDMHFWGLKLENLKKCCRRKLLDFIESEKLIEKFSDQFERIHPQHSIGADATTWERVRRNGWDIMDDPHSSVYANMCLAVKAFAMLLYIFNNAVSTTNLFKNELSMEETNSYLDTNKHLFEKVCKININPDFNDVCNAFHNRFAHSLTKREIPRQHADYNNVFYPKSGKTLVNTKTREIHMNNLVDTVHHTEHGLDIMSKDMNNAKPLANTKQHVTVNKSHAFVAKQKSFFIETPTNATLKRKPLASIKNDNLSVRSVTTTESDLNKNHIKQAGNDRNLSYSYENKSGDVDSKLIPTYQHIAFSKSKLFKRVKRQDQQTLDEQDSGLFSQHSNDNILHGINHTHNATAIFQDASFQIVVRHGLSLYFTIEFFSELTFSPNRMNYLRRFYTVIDLLNIINLFAIYVFIGILYPAMEYTSILYHVLQGFQSVKALKLFSLVKDLRAFRVLIFSIKTTYKDVVSLIIYMLILTTIAAVWMYYLEQENMGSIPQAMWWAVVTVTTVGYGDVVPQSVLGKCLGSICAVGGILVVALMVPMFVNDFLIFNKFSKTKRKDKYALSSLFNRISIGDVEKADEKNKIHEKNKLPLPLINTTQIICARQTQEQNTETGQTQGRSASTEI